MQEKIQYKLSKPFNYENDYSFAENNPTLFWDEIATKYIVWDKKYESIYNGEDLTKPDWFSGGLLNTCYNSLDFHLNNQLIMDSIAIVFECPFLKISKKLTYAALYERVCEFSRVLLNLGISKGDNVMIKTTNSIEGIITMLSCSRIGAIFCPLVKCLSESELITRLELIEPKVIVTCNYEVINDEIKSFSPTLISALGKSIHKPHAIISVNRKRPSHYLKSLPNEFIPDISSIPNSLDWDEQILKSKSNPFYQYCPVESNHPFYMIYTSGTTGTPKLVVMVGSSIVGCKYNWFSQTSNKRVDGNKQLTIFVTSEMGSGSFTNLLFPILSAGDKFVFLEGSPSNPNNNSEIWEIIERTLVNMLFVLPSFMNFATKLYPNAEMVNKFDISSLNSIWSGGDPYDQSIIDYVEMKMGKNLDLMYNQTEARTKILYSGYQGKQSKNNIKIFKPTPFYRLSILSTVNGNEVGSNEYGELVCKLPLIPGFAHTFYKDDTRFNALFQKYPGYYSTGDIAVKDNNGNIKVIARLGDTVKVNCIDICLNDIGFSILKHSMVLDCCCVVLKSQLSSDEEVPIGVLVLKNNNTPNSLLIDKSKLLDELNSIIANDINSFASLKSIIIVLSIPKTNSGKNMRSILTNCINDYNFKLPNKFENIDLLNEIRYQCNLNKL